jgi:hypothetical protein
VAGVAAIRIRQPTFEEAVHSLAEIVRLSAKAQAQIANRDRQAR